MFKTVDELKEFILWAKDQKVQSVKVDNIEFTMSNYALIQDLIGPTSQTSSTKPRVEEVVPPIPDPTKPPPEDPDLFWSAIP